MFVHKNFIAIALSKCRQAIISTIKNIFFNNSLFVIIKKSINKITNKRLLSLKQKKTRRCYELMTSDFT